MGKLKIKYNPAKFFHTAAVSYQAWVTNGAASRTQKKVGNWIGYNDRIGYNHPLNFENKK